MEEFISFLTHIYTTHTELVLIGGGSGIVVLISILLFFLMKKEVKYRQGNVEPEGISHMENVPAEPSPPLEEKSVEELETDEGIGGELTEEEVARDVELEEFKETVKEPEA